MNVTPPDKIDLLGLSQDQMTSILVGLGEKPYRTAQVMKWLHHRSVTAIDEMTDISKKLRAEFKLNAEIHEPEMISEQVSADGTRKWLLRARSGSAIETVFIPEGTRGTLCVSSQVGCVLDCKFCSTGKQGFNSNLTAGEIVGQLRVAERQLAGIYPARKRAVTNIVLMGMGEPLLNIEQDASLAISLHAPNDALRDQLVPINRKYPIAQLLSACRDYAENLGEKRTVTIEYTLLDGVNDQAFHAEELAALLADFPCKINLIPFNPFPGSGFRRPNAANVRYFQEYLVNKGFSAMVRTTRGDDIDAACGQLAGQVADRTQRSARYRKIAAEGGLI
jgi:23S rRNA (adenine2503-C2)-methyltransferase